MQQLQTLSINTFNRQQPAGVSSSHEMLVWLKEKTVQQQLHTCCPQMILASNCERYMGGVVRVVCECEWGWGCGCKCGVGVELGLGVGLTWACCL